MLKLGASTGKLRSLLCLGAHCDDIEIGCGGSVLRLLAENPGLQVTWVVLSSDERRAKEARASAESFLEGAAASSINIGAFRDSFFPYEGAKLKEHLLKIRQDLEPDLIFTHHGGDRHQDHRIVSELTWNLFRDHLILEYEIPKYDGDMGAPNFFVPLDQAQCRRKLEIVMESFVSQQGRSWFTEETFRALLRIRGVESNAASGYAEGFYARKCVF